VEALTLRANGNQKNAIMQRGEEYWGLRFGYGGSALQNLDGRCMTPRQEEFLGEKSGDMGGSN